MHKIGIVIGAKSQGSNMRAIAQACRTGELDAEVIAVVAPSADAPGLAGAPNPKVVEPGDDYGTRLKRALEGADLVCLAGFMRLLPSEVLAHWPGQVLNIHPSLLPRFGGQGMYGRRVHEAVLAAGESVSGCTVHRVTPDYDEGEIVLQTSCLVLPDDTVDSLAERVRALEHLTYVRALKEVLRGL